MDELIGKSIIYVDGYFGEQQVNEIACDVKQGKSVHFEIFINEKTAHRLTLKFILELKFWVGNLGNSY